MFLARDVSEIVFSVVWIVVLALIAYSFLKSCFGRPTTTNRRPQNPGDRRGSSGWFPGSYGDDYAPPPPYTKTTTDQGWRPGFWTGAALGAWVLISLITAVQETMTSLHPLQQDGYGTGKIVGDLAFSGEGEQVTNPTIAARDRRTLER